MPRGRTGRRRGRPGSRRPPRRGSEALAFLAALAVAAAVVAIVVANVHSGKPHRTAAATSPGRRSGSTKAGAASSSPPTRTQPVPASVAIPPHFAPQSFTAIGELTWWLLGPAPCTVAGEKPPCGVIARTSDGGRTFTGIPAPQAPLSSPGSGQSGYSELRLADAKSGFAFRPDLYATHDGGMTWHAIQLGGRVGDVAISGGHAYAVVLAGSGNAGHLMASSVGRDAWSAVSAAGVVSGGLWVQGREVIVQSGAGTGIGGNVLVSQDGGASFTTYAAPSPGLPCQFAAPEPPVVWAHCATGTESGVWRSTDGGAHFTIAAGTGTSLRLANSAPFAAASASTAVVGAQQIYRTTSSGALWSPVGPSDVAQWAYLGFTDSTHGVALGYVGQVAPANERLYYTTDGAQSYHLVPLP